MACVNADGLTVWVDEADRLSGDGAGTARGTD